LPEHRCNRTSNCSNARRDATALNYCPFRTFVRSMSMLTNHAVIQSCVESRYVVPPYLLKVSQSRTGPDLLRLNKILSDYEDRGGRRDEHSNAFLLIQSNCVRSCFGSSGYVFSTQASTQGRRCSGRRCICHSRSLATAALTSVGCKAATSFRE